MSRAGNPTIIEAISEIMARHGMLQKDFAQLLRMEPSTINRWMSGAVKPPRHAELFVRLLYDDRMLVETIRHLPEDLFATKP